VVGGEGGVGRVNKDWNLGFKNKNPITPKRIRKQIERRITDEEKDF